MRPKITFITPTFNAAATIEDTILSVEREAEGLAYEHWFIDGQSTDETLKIIRRLKGADALLISEPDDGVYDAMNKGIGRAQGEWIAILNADDYYLPGAVAAMMEAASASPTAAVLHGDMIVEFAEPIRIAPGLGWRGRLGSVHPISHPTMFAKSDVYARLGCYNTAYRFAADQEFFFRLLDRGEMVKYLQRDITLMRTGGLSGRYYDEGTLELLSIHRNRKCLTGRLAQFLFYKEPRLRIHPQTPELRADYLAWALKDFLWGPRAGG